MRRYVISKNWQHILPDHELVQCRFVIDTCELMLVAVHIKRGRRWFRATSDQHSDIEDSVVHSQADLPEAYRDFGMTSTSAIPDWAVDRNELSRRRASRKLRARPVPDASSQMEFNFH